MCADHSMGTQQLVTAKAARECPDLICAGDHAMGVELQIVELVEQQARATVQHRNADAERLGQELALLRSELASTTEQIIGRPPVIHLTRLRQLESIWT